MVVLNSSSAGVLLFLNSIHSEMRKTCVAYLSKTYLLLFDFQVLKGILRLNCAERVDPTLGIKHQNNNINVDSR